MLNFLITIVAFGFLIAIHELGHFIAAKLCKVGVEKFAIGFGAAILHFTKGETEYRIGWIPLGGYVKMRGENPEDTECQATDAFQSKAWWKKAIIAFSGPFANLLIAFVLFFAAYALPIMMEDHPPVVGRINSPYIVDLAIGDSISSINNTPVKGWYQGLGLLKKDEQNSLQIIRDSAKVELILSPAQTDTLIRKTLPKVPSLVGDLQTGMPAWKAGLKRGDVIIAVDSLNVKDWYEMREAIIGSGRRKVELLLKRGDTVYSRTLELENNFQTEYEPRIGIIQMTPVRYRFQYSPLEAVKTSFKHTIMMIEGNYRGLYHLIRKPEELKDSLGGPVLIVTMSQEMGAKGANTLILFFGTLSIILMVMNLLPIPILDGGHIIFAIIEGIIRKPIPLRVQGFLQRIGFALLILMMVYAFYNDFLKLGSRIFNTLPNK